MQRNLNIKLGTIIYSSWEVYGMLVAAPRRTGPSLKRVLIMTDTLERQSRS